MAGRTGTYDPKTETWSDVIYMPCTKETNFAPELPKETPDIIYLCFPNNPTGSTITKEQLQEWVDYANKVGAVTSTMGRPRHTFLRMMYHIQFTSVREQEPVRSRLRAFLRMQDSRVYVWEQLLFRKISSRAM